MAGVRKALAALVALVGTWGVTAVADGAIDAVEWFGLLVVLGGSGAVWGIPNAAATRAARPLRAPGR